MASLLLGAPRQGALAEELGWGASRIVLPRPQTYKGSPSGGWGGEGCYKEMATKAAPTFFQHPPALGSPDSANSGALPAHSTLE